MRRVVRTGPTLRLWVAALGLPVTAACLTPVATRSVAVQVEEIRRQTEEVQRAQQHNSAAIEALETSAPPAAESLAVEPVAGAPPAPAEPAAAPPAVEAEAPILPPLETSPLPVPAATPPGAVSEAAGAPGSGTRGGLQGAAAPIAALYRQGYALYHRGEYVASERRLRQVVDADPRGPLAGNARYWIGETYFARGLYREAIEEFNAIVELLPADAKAAHAAYKIALCHEKLGDRVRMENGLRAVLRDYPHSDVAALARARLRAP